MQPLSKLFITGAITGLSFLLARKASAQEDVLYLKNNEKKIGRVTEISQKKVEIQTENNSNDRIDKSELDLILFGNGSFMTFPSEYKGSEAPTENRHPDDWLLTRDEFIVACKIENGETDPVKVRLAGSDSPKEFEVPRSALAAILFANGRKQLLGSKPALIAGILQKKSMKSGSEFLAAYEAKKAEPKQEKTVTGRLELDPASQEQLQNRGLQKARDLGKYLSVIASKNTEAADAYRAVEQAVILFLSDSSQVETKQPNGERRVDFIRNYLTRLRMLKYSKVEIEWSEIAYVSNLRRAPDGNYYGVISVLQKFTGYLDNKPVFSDNTRKNIEIVLKTYRKEVDGESLELWDVFLNNIGISASK